MQSTMKAAVYTEYGPPDVLHLTEVEKPAPEDHEVCVRVRATSVNYGDLTARNFRSISPGDFNMPFLFWVLGRVAFGLREPRTNKLGSEFAGDVESVGQGVTRFKEGDEVFGYRAQAMGAYAEYLCAPEESDVAVKPTNMSYEEAAVVQLLKHEGADVTGVCSTPRMAFVESLGADRVLDYTREDFTESGETYDLIIDILGRSSFSRCRRVLKEGSRYLLASFKMKQLLQMAWTSRVGSRKVICALAPETSGDLPQIRELIEAGEFKAAIDKSFPLAQAAEAHR